jgi:hypothetical protein
MAHCTHRRALAAVALLCLATAAAAPVAWADGDPASDVLATQSVFLPQDAGASAAEQAELAGLLQEAHRSGFPIRVAVVASSADLGSVTALWRQPQSYARFLGQELSQVYAGPLLVVMPSGLGLYGFRDLKRSQSTAGAGATGTALATVAADAVQRLAAAAGHHLSRPTTTPAAASRPASAGVWAAFAVGLLAILAAWVASFRARPPRPRVRRSQAP